MVVLDTDLVSLLDRGTPEARRLLERLCPLSAPEKATTIVSDEEQMRGWMAYIAQATTLARQIDGYRRLRRDLDKYRSITVLDFDEMAAVQFQRLRQARVRVGTMDLKIAAIALAHDATLLTRNLADFRKVPGLKVEDWSA